MGFAATAVGDTRSAVGWTAHAVDILASQPLLSVGLVVLSAIALSFALRRSVRQIISAIVDFVENRRLTVFYGTGFVGVWVTLLGLDALGGVIDLSTPWALLLVLGLLVVSSVFVLDFERARSARAEPIKSSRANTERILEAYNLAQAEAYQARVDPTRDALARTFARHLRRFKMKTTWGRQEETRRFLDFHWRAQADFVDVLEEGDAQAARIRALTALFPRATKADNRGDEQTGVWLVGAAGCGKTTLMHRIYFELIARCFDDKAAPIPILIEPRNLESSKAASRLREESDPLRLFHLVLELWLEHRGIGSEASATALEELILQGRVIVLLDGYDELARLRLQAKIVSALRTWAKNAPIRYLIASRPEVAENEPALGEKIIQLASSWDLNAATKYIQLRARSATADMKPGGPGKMGELEKFLARQPQASWLRTPRSLSMLVQLAERDEAKARELFGEVAVGEYELLERLVGYAYFRLEPFLNELALNNSVLEAYLEEMARVCSLHGVMEVDASEPMMQVLRRADDFIVLRPISEVGDTPRVGRLAASFVNPNFLDFFLVAPIVKHIRERRGFEAAYHFKWSQSLLDYVTAKLADTTRGARAEDLLLPLFDKFRLSPQQQSLLNAPEASHGANLLQVAARWKRLNGEDLVFVGAAGWRDLSRLDLSGADLSSLQFNDCQFSSSRLVRTKLRNTRFENCDFSDAEFINADATGASFSRCAFNFTTRPGAISPVHQMLVEGTDLRDSGEYSIQSFVDAGAHRYSTRYRGAFSLLFSDKTAALTQGDTEKATDFYASLIEDALRRRGGAPILLADVMAGGSNPQLRRVLTEVAAGPLNVLAIDRDTSQLHEFKQRFEMQSGERRLLAYQKELIDSIDFQTILARSFIGPAPTEIDIIVSKKAFHEMKRLVQPELIRECAEVLKVGGDFIIYADAPPAMGPHNVLRLDEVRDALLKAHAAMSAARTSHAALPELEALRRLLLEELKFAANDEDYGLFANLWVMVKDWANENIHEVENRFFSSEEELTEWTAAASSSAPFVLQPIRTERFSYMLFPLKFNETGTKRVLDHLDSMRAQSRAYAPETVAQLWGPNARFELFQAFSERHLWDGGAPSAFGAHVGARVEQVGLSDFDSALAGLSSRGVGFRFPVSVMAFQKQTRSQSQHSTGAEAVEIGPR